MKISKNKSNDDFDVVGEHDSIAPKAQSNPTAPTTSKPCSNFYEIFMSKLTRRTFRHFDGFTNTIATDTRMYRSGIVTTASSVTQIPVVRFVRVTYKSKDFKQQKQIKIQSKFYNKEPSKRICYIQPDILLPSHDGFETIDSSVEAIIEIEAHACLTGLRFKGWEGDGVVVTLRRLLRILHTPHIDPV